MTNQPTTDPAPPPPAKPRSRRFRYTIACILFAIIILFLSSTSFSSRIIPPSPAEGQSFAALIVHQDRAWLTLPRPDGTLVSYSFGPRQQTSGLLSWAKSTPASLSRKEFGPESTLLTISQDFGGQEFHSFPVPQDKAFALVDSLDTLFNKNLATLSPAGSPGTFQVNAPDDYSPMTYNTNQWAAAQLRTLSTRVDGLGLSATWSVDSASH